MSKVGSGGGSKLETAISYLFIIGVMVSLVLEVIGMALFHRTYGDLSISQGGIMFIQGRDFFNFIGHLQGGHGGGGSVLFMTLGVAVLLLTPYLKVVLSAFYFAGERNVKYVFITLFVLAVLTVSLALH